MKRLLIIMNLILGCISLGTSQYLEGITTQFDTNWIERTWIVAHGQQYFFEDKTYLKSIQKIDAGEKGYVNMTYKNSYYLNQFLTWPSQCHYYLIDSIWLNSRIEKGKVIQSKQWKHISYKNGSFQEHHKPLRYVLSFDCIIKFKTIQLYEPGLNDLPILHWGGYKAKH